MNKVLRYAMQGAGYGSVAYLLLLASHLENWPHSSGRIVSVLLMSAAIGILTLVFDLSLIHISEPTRRRGISYAVFCLKKKKKKNQTKKKKTKQEFEAE
ncbi:hypothetical protein [Lactobacillus koreensis] [Lactiplantibacillus mudanjiangensis]|nr:hypothetical protein [Lactobacillus koreensis] [Lactiplantibacillus mudanjiangensis]